MSFYQVIDLQGCAFMSYTRRENWTKEDIRVHLRDQFRDQQEEDTISDNVTLDEMLDLFELDIEPKEALEIK